MENTAVVVCLHGDELFGLEILDRLQNKIPVFVGNLEAIEKRVRYIDSDLNRVFPGDANGNYEEKRAVELLEKIKPYKYIVDIHSSSSDLELFGIITKPNDEKIELAKKLGLKKLVIMPEFFASGKSLIDFADCGISLEIGPHEVKKNIDEIVDAITNSPDSQNELQMYEIAKGIEGENIEDFFIKNFQEVKKGDLIARSPEKEYYAEDDFIALFVGEKAYKGLICLVIKKMDEIN